MLNLQSFSLLASECAGYCTHVLNGIVNGGRCFFDGNQAANWTDAFSACHRMDGTLAKIHTSSEYNTVVSWMAVSDAFSQNAGCSNKSFQGISGGVPTRWIALRRDDGVSGYPCSIVLDSTYWYDSTGTKNLQLASNRTWIRTHACDDLDSSGSDFSFGLSVINPSRFFDASCSLPTTPLCQFTSKHLHFEVVLGASYAALVFSCQLPSLQPD